MECGALAALSSKAQIWVPSLAALSKKILSLEQVKELQ
jgi:hypothetical protein